ncbi:hypothetical protein Afer_1090 [Acidimicrobium ferrooxidans DSM 10331]|uniref:Uncharacterized protein n=1 Tax=Acidimicrobium ferrooxidans (strain DSM 10331 / JCM 15462 / NBRC 103882 / ICP) TaxID=525909 RepID=C7LZ65_ACIFD|nr:hypothetical protein Afer_1090 [Acidimicrobium ferrooxidans DSM 10331]
MLATLAKGRGSAPWFVAMTMTDRATMRQARSRTTARWHSKGSPEAFRATLRVVSLRVLRGEREVQSVEGGPKTITAL